MVPVELEIITHSRKVAFRACQRRHHYAYELGARPVRPSKPLVVGDVLHRWLEAWFRAGQRWVSPTDLDAPVESPQGALRALEAVDAYEAAKLRAMVLAYHQRWSAERWSVLAVEAQFRAPLEHPTTGQVSQLYERGGKLDAVIGIEFEHGGPDWEGQWVVEHKSNSGPLDLEDIYWQRLRMDPQCSDYFVGAHALGFRPRGIIYDVVCKPTIEPRLATPEDRRKMTIGIGCSSCGGGKAAKGTGCFACDGTGWRPGKEPRWYADTRLHDETPGEYGQRCFEVMTKEPDRYLHRRKVVRLQHEIDEHLLDDWMTVKALHEQRASGAAPRNPDACFLHNRPCDYWPVCGRAASIDDPRLFQITGPHPELRVVNDW